MENHSSEIKQHVNMNKPKRNMHPLKNDNKLRRKVKSLRKETESLKDMNELLHTKVQEYKKTIKKAYDDYDEISMKYLTVRFDYVQVKPITVAIGFVLMITMICVIVYLIKQ